MEPIRQEESPKVPDLRSLHFKDLRSFPILPKEELEQRVLEAQGGSKEALEDVVGASGRFVVSVAMKYRTRTREGLMDLVSEGYVGLVRSINKYDPVQAKESGASFLSYAIWWIRQAIEESLRGKDTVRIPQRVYTAALQILRDLGPQASIQEICELLGCSKDFAGNVQRSLVNVISGSVSLDASAPGADSPLMETIRSDWSPEDEGMHSPDSDLGQRDMSKLLKEVFDILPKEDASILQDLYGVGRGGVPCTLQELASIQGCTVTAISGRRNRALYRARKILKERSQGMAPDIF